jgi:hypothetical protein
VEGRFEFLKHVCIGNGLFESGLVGLKRFEKLSIA